MLAFLAPAFSMSLNAQADEPKTAGSEEAAKKGAQGSLSAGAIAAAVAAAAAIAEITDDDDSPAPTPAAPGVAILVPDIPV